MLGLNSNVKPILAGSDRLRCPTILIGAQSTTIKTPDSTGTTKHPNSHPKLGLTALDAAPSKAIGLLSLGKVI